MYAKPYLEKYKGKASRYTCPQCERQHIFTRYLDGNTHQHIHSTVGICSRKSKCGYHYPPKQYFLDNPDLQKSSDYNNTSNTKNVVQHTTPSPSGRAGVGSSSPLSTWRGVGGEVPFSYVERSASYQSNFVRFLCEFLTTEQISFIGDKYALGATKNKEVIFWQIDTKGKVRSGKIMQYNALTGKRIKHETGAIDWVHNKLKKLGTLPEDFNLQQCFFGEHILGLNPEATVCIVESEKSALIAAAFFPNEIWLASGGLDGLTVDKSEVLKNRTVILYPDLNGYDKWVLKAFQIQNKCDCNISVSTLLEDIATPEAKAKGLDIADYMINQLTTPLSQNTQEVNSLSPNGESTRRGIEVRGYRGEVIQPPETIPIQQPPVQNPFTPELESMTETNPALLLLINKLDLIEY